MCVIYIIFYDVNRICSAHIRSINFYGKGLCMKNLILFYYFRERISGKSGV